MVNIERAYERLTALSLSQRGKTAPNPNVAAAIYSADGELISEGAHNRLLSPDHAEVIAIKQAGAAAYGATIVVTLEPCNHTGNTGPCVDAIIDAGINTVIYAVSDPNPKAAGGAERLRAAGVDVRFIDSPELRAAQSSWLHRMSTGHPYFIWKIAATLDGRIAAADGTSQWISSSESRTDVQFIRNESDAILIGTGTALADNPKLLPRIHGGTSPIRLVMGKREIPADFNLRDETAKTIFIQSHEIEELLRVVSEEPINQVLVEAGSTLGSVLFRAGVIDEVLLYQAPILLGAGKNWLEDIGISTIGDAAKLSLISSEQMGSDMKLRYKVEKR